jgi:LacI family transcriptional regulator
LVANHFLGLGHSRIAVIAGPPHASTSVDRVRGFLETLRKAGVEVPPSMVVPSAFDVHGGRSSAAQLLKGSPRPTAIFAVNDYAAIGVMGMVRATGLRVGVDVAVVGYNNISIDGDLLVPLTSISVPIDEMGRIAVEMLLSRIAGQVPDDSRRLTPALIVRESSIGFDNSYL